MNMETVINNVVSKIGSDTDEEVLIAKMVSTTVQELVEGFNLEGPDDVRVEWYEGERTYNFYVRPTPTAESIQLTFKATLHEDGSFAYEDEGDVSEKDGI